MGLMEDGRPPGQWRRQHIHGRREPSSWANLQVRESGRAVYGGRELDQAGEACIRELDITEEQHRWERD